MKSARLPLFSLFFLIPFFVTAQDAADPFDFQHRDTMLQQDFSFWVGEWDVYQTGTEQLVGKSRIERMLGGNYLRESYFSTQGYEGTSINTYNQAFKRWEQYYVDNGGLVLHIKGNFDGKSMVLMDCSEENLNCNRISFTPLADGNVQQVWDQSKDGGQNWSNAFDGTYVPTKH